MVIFNLDDTTAILLNKMFKVAPKWNTVNNWFKQGQQLVQACSISTTTAAIYLVYFRKRWFKTTLKVTKTY